MKASVLIGPRNVEIQDRKMPQPGPGEVRVKVMAVGICGSDVHYYQHGRIGPTEMRYPLILGHEPAGIINAAGPGVILTPGTRVAVEPAILCQTCEYCLSGHGNLCSHVHFLGTPPTDGILSQYRIMPERNCLPVPDSLSLVESAMLEPLSVGFHAVRLSGLGSNEIVAVVGCGPIGLVTMMAARVAGASRIYMTDLIPKRIEMAKHLGADAVMNPAEGNVRDWLLDLTNNRGVDIAFEAAGSQDGLLDCCAVTRPGGKVIMIGSPKSLDLSIPMHDCRRKELLMQHVRRSNGETHAAMDLVASGKINLKPLATHHFELENVAAAFDMAHNYIHGIIRAIVYPKGIDSAN